MMLVEQTTVPGAALPVAEFKEHLRLGTGFADDGVQDTVLEAYLRAATAAIEARIGKALIERSYSWSLTAWRDLSSQALPIAPVSAITSLVITDRLGLDEIVDPARYLLEPDTHRPRLVAKGLVLPSIPVGGHVTISFDAGFGPAWSDVPTDLAQAVMVLGAYFYENRASGAGSDADVPSVVHMLTERWRNVRLFGGGAQ